MEHYKTFMAFLVFNLFFLYNGLGIIGGAVYLLIKIRFNNLSIIMITIGIIIILIFSLGLKTRKNLKILALYLLFMFIIFLFYAGLSVMIKLKPDLLIKYIKSKIMDNDEIKIINTLFFILACIGISCCFLAFILGYSYYRKLRYKIEQNESEQDILHGIDYNNIDDSFDSLT